MPSLARDRRGTSVVVNRLMGRAYSSASAGTAAPSRRPSRRASGASLALASGTTVRCGLDGVRPGGKAKQKR